MREHKPDSPLRSVMVQFRGTILLCAVTLATGVLQSIIGGDTVARAVGVDLGRVWSLSALIEVAVDQVIPGWLTLLVYVFPHGGWWHLLPNLGGLGFFGALAERDLGSRAILGLYFLSGVIGVLCHSLLPPYPLEPVAGASLAICGLLGAHRALPRAGAKESWPQKASRQIFEFGAVSIFMVWLITRGAAPCRTDRLHAFMYHLAPALVMWFAMKAWLRVHGILSSRSQS